MTESVWLDAGGEKGGREEGKTEREREGKKRTIVDVSLHAKWLPFLPGKEIFWLLDHDLNEQTRFLGGERWHVLDRRHLLFLIMNGLDFGLVLQDDRARDTGNRAWLRICIGLPIRCLVAMIFSPCALFGSPLREYCTVQYR